MTRIIRHSADRFDHGQTLGAIVGIVGLVLVAVVGRAAVA
jgi:hypothetical protein